MKPQTLIHYLKNSFLFLIIFIIFGCQEKKISPTKGNLKVYTDESVYNLILKEKDAFDSLYTEAKIEVAPLTAREGIAKILNSEIKIFVCSRDFNKEELEFIKQQKSELQSFKFCYDAVVAIVSKGNSLTEIKLSDLKKALLGEKKDIKIYLPQKNSGVYEYLKTEVLEGKDFSSTVQITESEFAVKEQILKNKNAIGLIGLNILKDTSDVTLLKIGYTRNPLEPETFYQPHQGYMINGSYPLTRTIYALLNEVGLGLASGFVTFLTSFPGQEIVKNNNLGPAAIPVKLNSGQK
ncbi:MAG: substrate-binding domain-containing protein [Ignavibacteriaceae bacterium]|jgi:phosphate transport system substrate-binding protein|nr:substrate-binding domain-containing protein [Ignavibacteriaceae bacterium]